MTRPVTTSQHIGSINEDQVLKAPRGDISQHINAEKVLQVFQEHGRQPIKELGYEVRKRLDVAGCREPGTAAAVFRCIRNIVNQLEGEGALVRDRTNTYYLLPEKAADKAARAKKPRGRRAKDKPLSYINGGAALAGSR